MKAGLYEIHYLPCMQYCSKWFQFDSFYLEQHENYSKGSYRNRTCISGANGPLRLSIPLKKGKNQQQPIREVQIDYSLSWQRQHWAAIASAYGNAPFFDYYADQLLPFFNKPLPFLFDFNLQIIHLLINLLEVEHHFLLTSEYQTTPTGVFDGRNTISPKKHKHLSDPHFSPIPYPQVFQEKHGFIQNLSVLDLLFCTGPQAPLILESCIK